MAKFTSPTQGKDGTSHFGDLENLHIVSPISMLGDLIPVMAGVALAGRYLGQKIVALTWIGDGGSSTGVFHEGLNFAAVQKAALVLVLENNQWAYSTPVRRQVPIENLADRAKAYGIASYIVDGNDVVAVYTAAKEAVDRARGGDGPALLEVKTFRRRGHAQHDPAEYVPRKELQYWENRDPVLLYEKFLMGEKILDAKGKQGIENEITALLEKEREFAENSPMPPPELAAQGVYCSGPECHDLQPKWERPIAEVEPPRCSVKNAWPPYTHKSDFGAPVEPIQFIPAASLGSMNGNKPSETKLQGNKPAAKPVANRAASSATKKTTKKGAR